MYDIIQLYLGYTLFYLSSTGTFLYVILITHSFYAYIFNFSIYRYNVTYKYGIQITCIYISILTHVFKTSLLSFNTSNDFYTSIANIIFYFATIGYSIPHSPYSGSVVYISGISSKVISFLSETNGTESVFLLKISFLTLRYQ